ncbi:MAG: SDR family oxidoreductase [Microlunatus sp.]|nr:SDR family oxidoreductase [Microlunatus sp.]
MTRPDHHPQILLTGASGVLGSVIAAELAQVADLTCLTRRRPVALPGVNAVAGDLSRPGLGLSTRALDELHSRTDVVLHCGALTAFTSGANAPDQVNRDGTARILDLVAAADADLVHVSTAFVDRAAEFVEASPVDTGRPSVRSPEHYLRSKIAAERAVVDSGLRFTIVRPSVLIGDSVTGAIGQFQGWHQMCAGIISGHLPFLPADGAALVDCIPVDQAARAVAGLALTGIGREVPSGSEFWLTAGTAAATIDATIDASLEVAGDRGLSPQRPRTLAREMVERLVLPAFGQSVPPHLLKQMLEGLELMRLFGSSHCFPSSWPTVLGLSGPDQHGLLESVFTSLEYLAETLGLGRGVKVA